MDNQMISDLCSKLSRTYLSRPIPPRLKRDPSEFHRKVVDYIGSGISGMKRFESPEVKKYALKVLDNDGFREEIVKVSQEYGSTKTDPEKQIMALLRWFKGQLFIWVSKLPCEFCKEEDTSLIGVEDPNSSESSGDCSRVEVYRCPKCNKTSRFPRFNNPVRVLQARRGRCGEYTTGFIALVRSLGFDVRLVNDFEDHVWAEVYFPGLKRWLHADPSEGILDEPLTYAVGWGKQPVIVMGTSARFGASDVTIRYTPDFVKLTIPRRRQKGLQGRLVYNSIHTINAILAQPPSAAALAQLQREENEELAGYIIKPRETGFHAGRQSGSTEWRKARGELGSISIDIKDFQTTKVFDSTANPTLLKDLAFNGNARFQETSALLTPCVSDQTGSIFLKAPIDISHGFRLGFKFQISAGDGADGLAVVFQAQGPSALGKGGCGLGYAGIKDCVALEIDTYRSFDRCSDPDGNHISLQAGKSDGNGKYTPVSSHHSSSLGWTPASQLPNFQTGEWFCMSVILLPSGHFQVSLKADKEEDDQMVVVLDIPKVDFTSLTNGNSLLFFGFSAATGGLSQSHTVSSIEIDRLNAL
ncbi:peptide-N4-(N-acetyl-beta- glucosaminyl)asparagine amidase [Entomophthora muscae]|uniref:Peptide-N4-(N-acetyl-beta-glucosaminyl)asparagine amidase n=1 Tax=Entomophthora muscae TaxID=34485 RepID=A0ACC2SN17_9FUNG|nr:peptide-N4-(N-acetyl-beta- glucosaminyl)asparagine amidase [Entomophthora muscae]